MADYSVSGHSACDLSESGPSVPGSLESGPLSSGYSKVGSSTSGLSAFDPYTSAGPSASCLSDSDAFESGLSTPGALEYSPLESSPVESNPYESDTLHAEYSEIIEPVSDCDTPAPSLKIPRLAEDQSRLQLSQCQQPSIAWNDIADFSCNKNSSNKEKYHFITNTSSLDPKYEFPKGSSGRCFQA